MLDQFINEHCRVESAATCKLADFVAEFHEFAGDEARRWPRHTIIIELDKRFALGRVNNTLRIGGLGLGATRWESREGRLVLV